VSTFSLAMNRGSTTWQLLQSVRRKFGVRYVIDTGADHRAAVFLAGTARSGTTWVSELINHRGEYRYVFEPFNHKKLPLVAPFGGRRYLRPEDPDPELLRIANLVLSGKIRSSWTERFNRRLIANRRLIKDVRANLFLKWLHTHFPGMPIVLVVRHPCAVAHSYAKHGWGGAVEPLLAQESLVQDYLRPYAPAIARAKDPFERAVFIWCVETLVALKQFKSSELHVVFYEQLIQRPELEIARLFSFLGRAHDASIMARFARPSLTARRDSAVRSGANQIDSWRDKIDPAQLRRTLEIVRQFGLDDLYSADAMPNPRGLANLMSA
jgi:hypothetical protein